METEQRESKAKSIPAIVPEYRALPTRGLTQATAEFWKYGVAQVGGEWVHVAQFFDEQGTLVAQKTRDKDKNFVWRMKNGARMLFGRHLWRDSGRKVVITEGEIDAASVSQVQDHKWPVVSVPSGAQGAHLAIKANLEWLEQFDEVVFMFDNDAEGNAAAVECAEILSPGKAKIARLPLKDANAMLLAGRTRELVDSIWSAREYRPDGVLAGDQLWEITSAKDTSEPLPYPWPGLNAKLRGARCGEIVLFCGGSGIGKSEFVRQTAYHFVHGIVGSKERVGYIALEESVQRTALGFMGLAAGKRMHETPDEFPIEERKDAFDKTLGTGRWFLYDGAGAIDYKRLINKMRFLVKGCGCTTLVLDHISMLVVGDHGGDDERKEIDAMMYALRDLVKETNVRCVIVSHIKRTKENHNEGGRVCLNDLRGSGAIGQVAFDIIAVERNQQSEKHSNISRLRVLKARKTGRLGLACSVRYDPESGILTETTDTPEAFTKPEEGSPF
jgi:twinkle protein